MHTSILALALLVQAPVSRVYLHAHREADRALVEGAFDEARRGFELCGARLRR
jgi:hypothetical protein